jgi:hypothetical protein
MEPTPNQQTPSATLSVAAVVPYFQFLGEIIKSTPAGTTKEWEKIEMALEGQSNYSFFLPFPKAQLNPYNINMIS